MSEQPKKGTRAIGRPTVYQPSFCDAVIGFGQEGMSKAQMAARLGVCRNTLDNWCSDHPEFLSAFTRARDLAQDWWETKAQTNLETTTFNTSLWSRSMAARFPHDYAERRQVEMSGKDGGPIKTESTVHMPPAEAYLSLTNK